MLHDENAGGFMRVPATLKPVEKGLMRSARVCTSLHRRDTSHRRNVEPGADVERPFPQVGSRAAGRPEFGCDSSQRRSLQMGRLACGTAFAIQACNRLLMAEETSVNEDVLDAMGEVANMIIGNFKTLVEEHAGPLCLSIPTVIHGRNFTSRSLGNNSWVVLPFECNGDVMQIRVCLAESKNTVTPRAGSIHPVAVLA
ncbi:MAG: chemotaxis protein CheX [Candidatus Solibacter sp.]